MCPLLRTAAVLLALIWSGSLLAGDGGSGSSTAGSPVEPYAGLTLAGGTWGASTIYDSVYPGAASGMQDDPGATALSRTWMLPSMTSVRAGSQGQGSWTFASPASSPYVTDPVTAGSDPSSRSYSGYAESFVPVVASYHLGQTKQVAFALGIPTVSRGAQNWRAANGGSDLWTSTPKVAYAMVIPASDQQSSTVVAVGAFARKPDAISQYGAVGRVETAVMRQNSSGWGFGGVAALMQSPDQDSGALGGRPMNYNASSGGSLGLGPQVTWGTRWLGSKVDVQCRWLYESRGPTGHTEEPVLVTANLHF